MPAENKLLSHFSVQLCTTQKRKRDRKSTCQTIVAFNFAINRARNVSWQTNICSLLCHSLCWYNSNKTHQQKWFEATFRERYL